MFMVANWTFLTSRARAPPCIAHDPEVRARLRGQPGITQRSAYGTVTNPAEAMTCHSLMVAGALAEGVVLLVIEDLDGAAVERTGALVAREQAAARQVRPPVCPPAGRRASPSART